MRFIMVAILALMLTACDPVDVKKERPTAKPAPIEPAQQMNIKCQRVTDPDSGSTFGLVCEKETNGYTYTLCFAGVQGDMCSVFR